MGNIVDHIENVGGGGAGNTTSVSLASNTFTVGQWIHNNSGSYGLANAGDLATTEPLYGVVSSAGDPIFSVTTEGPVTLTAHGFGIGKVLYLSETNGEITETVPTEIYKQVGFVVDANTIFVRIGDTIVIGAGAEFAFQEYSFTGDGSSVNFDLPTNVGSVESVLIVVGGVPQKSTAYNIVSDGSGNPRRVQFTEAVPDGVEIFVRYLGITKAITTITPVSSTDYNSGTPVPLALSSTTDPSNIVSDSNFVFPHGLSSIPKSVEIRLRCLNAEHGYSIGEEVIADNICKNTGEPWFTVSSDSTNVYMMFNRLDTVPVPIIDKDGVSNKQSIDLSKWGVVVYANAEMGGTNGVIQAVNTPATEFESAVIRLASTSQTTLGGIDVVDSDLEFPHGLSQKPKSVRTVLHCLVANNGYQIGDEIPFDSHGYEVGPGQWGKPFWTVVDNTNITIRVNKNEGSVSVVILPKTEGQYSDVSIDFNQWGIKVYANSELGGYKGDRGPAGTGKIAQVKKHERSDYVNGTTQIPLDDTIPQNTEGDEYFSVTITPKNPDSVLKFNLGGTIFTSGTTTAAIFKDDDTNASTAWNLSAGPGESEIILPSGGTNTRTYKLRMGQDQASSGVAINGNPGGSRYYGGISKAVFSITEILP